RDKKIAQMRQFITSGQENGFIDKPSLDLFMQKYQGACARSHKIARQKESAIYTGPALKQTEINHDNEIDLRMFDFTKKRSAFFFGRESAEHEKLRIAADELKNMAMFKKEPVNNALGVYSPEKYLAKLDEVLYRSKFYQQEKKKEPSTPAGKKRLEGAKKLEEFAKQARKALLDEINESLQGDLKQYATLEEYRIECAKKTAETAAANMKENEYIPQGAGKNPFMKQAAQVLIGKIATMEGPMQDGFFIKGAAVLEKELLASKEFNRMMNNYSRNGIKPSQIITDLNSDIGINQLRKIREDLQKEADARSQKKTDLKASIAGKNKKIAEANNKAAKM
ncbi:MAG: hypothetical protein IK078_04600, partial [Lachnospiraceae bacterium]|nr:hypothetical protein [Lachnospiraceae bacterium]